MDADKRPTMKIPLGIAVDSMPTFGDLFDRAKRQVALVAAGQESLAYIKNEGFILGARLDVKDGNFELKAPIPVKPQADFFEHRVEGRRGRGFGLNRQDDDEQKAVDEAINAVVNSSRILDRVAAAINTSANLSAELKCLEKKEGVDTKPARRFIYHKQAEFIVAVEDENIPFKSHVVRAAVADPSIFNVDMTIVESRSESLVVRGLINVIHGDVGSASVRAGGIHEFRFVRLESWQKALLEAARWFNLPISLMAVKSVSTCTLNNLPAEVHQVQNWAELLDGTLAALQRIQNTSNNGCVEDLRDAA